MWNFIDVCPVKLIFGETVICDRDLKSSDLLSSAVSRETTLVAPANLTRDKALKQKVLVELVEMLAQDWQG